MSTNELLDRFLDRMRSAQPSTVTLAGTGPNGSSQLQVLGKIGRENLRALSRVNVISGSCASYFIYIAMLEDGFKPDGFRNYDRHVRELHKGSILTFLTHLLKQRHKTKPFFDNALLAGTLSIFLKEEFTARTLSTFDANVKFYAHCKTRGKVIEISAETQPEMTVKDIFRACISIPFLHGPFVYKDHQFIDPTFSESFSLLHRQLLAVDNNHLFVNIKKQSESRNVIFIKNDEIRFPVANMFIDFLCLCTGVPNWRVRRTHRAHLKNFSPDLKRPDL